MFEKILVAVDGSDHALKAARTAGEMARCMDADLWVATVFDPLPGYLGDPYMQEAMSKRMCHAEKILQQALAEVGSIPGRLSTETLEGPVAEAILAVLESRDIHLVVMGTRGLGRLSGLLLGSQSQKVLHHAPCPVLLVR